MKEQMGCVVTWDAGKIIEGDGKVKRVIGMQSTDEKSEALVTSLIEREVGAKSKVVELGDKDSIGFSGSFAKGERNGMCTWDPHGPAKRNWGYNPPSDPRRN